MTNIHISFIYVETWSEQRADIFWACKRTHIPTLPGCFCRILEAKKPSNTASTADGYCSRIPQQINMYSVQLHFILSVYRIIIFILGARFEALMKRFLTRVF